MFYKLRPLLFFKLSLFTVFFHPYVSSICTKKIKHGIFFVVFIQTKFNCWTKSPIRKTLVATKPVFLEQICLGYKRNTFQNHILELIKLFNEQNHVIRINPRINKLINHLKSWNGWPFLSGRFTLNWLEHVWLSALYWISYNWVGF